MATFHTISDIAFWVVLGLAIYFGISWARYG